MTLLRLLFVWFVLFGLGSCCMTIKAWHGSFITTDHDESCSFLLNGAALSLKELRMTRGYGMLQVSCSDCSEIVLSTFDACDDCLICGHNEGIKACRSLVTPLVLSGLLGFLISATMIFVFLKLDSKYGLINRLGHIISNRRNRRKNARIQKKIKFYRDHLEESAIPKNQGENSSDEEPLSPHPSRANDRRPSITSAIMLGLAVSNTLGLARSCDDLLYLSSEGQLYVDESYKSISSGLAILHTGSTLCTKYTDGTEESLKLISITVADHYAPMYKTCDFTINVKSTYNCLGAGRCWDQSECNSQTRNKDLGQDVFSVPDGQSSCIIVPNLSPSHCTHEQICIWYYWTIKKTNASCDVIYEFTHREEIATFEHKDVHGNTIPFSLSYANPTISLPLMIHLLTLQVPAKPASQNIREHGDVFFRTIAAKLNAGQPGLLGDFQESLHDAGTMHPTWSVDCNPSGSQISCTGAEPGYKRALLMDAAHPVQVSKTNRELVTKSTSRGQLSVLMRQMENPIQVVEYASCSVKLDFTYGCDGCLEEPYIVVSGRDIVSTGVLKFSSNCSFYLSEMYCSTQPQRIPLVDRETFCQIDFKGTNQTLNFEMKYEFLGEIFSMGKMTYTSQESFGDKLSLTLHSPSFMTGLKFSLGIGMLTTLLATSVRALSRYFAYKAGQKELEAVVT